MTTMYDVIVAFSGSPANDVEGFMMRFASVIFSIVFVYLILWLTVS